MATGEGRPLVEAVPDNPRRVTELTMQVRNKPTKEGREIGVYLARWADAALEKQLQQFPNMRDRCASCAFRSGSFPNGCLDTVMDALKCVMEGAEFMCHHDMIDDKPTEVCAGWLAVWSESATNGMPEQKAPWPFSHEDSQV